VARRQEATLSPGGVRSLPAGRHAEAGLDVSQKLHRAEVAASGSNLPLSLGTSPLAILSMLSCVFIVYSSPKSRMQVLVADHEPISPWRASRPILRQKAPRSASLWSSWMSVGVYSSDHDRLVLDQDVASLVVPPDALRLGLGGSAAEQTAQTSLAPIYPARLVDWVVPSPLGPRDEGGERLCFTSWAMDALSSLIVMTRDKWASSACALRSCWPEQELCGSATA